MMWASQSPFPIFRRAAVAATVVGALLLAAACAGGPDVQPRHEISLDARGALPEAPGAEVYGLSPEAFLDALTKTEGYWITLVDDAPEGWLTADHVAALEARSGSDANCPHVLSARAVNLPMDGASTEGAIARYMIAAARAGRFPIDLGSVDDDY